MTEIHQVLVGAGRTDAITSMARSIRSSLRKIGPSEIYAQHPAPGVDDVYLLEKLGHSTRSKRIIIFHASGGNPAVYDFLDACSDPVILIFHNIAPADLFEDIDKSRADDLRQGWKDLESLRSKVILTIADSEFNAQCLADHHYKNIEVLPLGVEVNRLHDLPSNSVMEYRLDRETSGPLLLFVGQSVPHKKIETLIQMQYLLSVHLGRESSLALVGPPTISAIQDAALEQARRLRVPNCIFLGQIQDDELATLYRRSSAFVTASLHEGLCIPAIEAMSFELPVIARETSALSETVGGAGILLPEDAGPEFFSEAVNELLENDSLRKNLIKSGKEKMSNYDSVINNQKFLDSLSQVI